MRKLLLGLAFLAAAGCVGGATVSPVAVACSPAPRPVPVGGDSLAQPIVVRSVDALLDVTLCVDTATFAIPSGDSTVPMLLRSYRLLAANGRLYDAPPSFPGPTFRVKPGDRVRVKLVNNLPPSDTLCQLYPASQQGIDSYPDCFHGPNWTNIHYHGFHVTPADSGDNVLVEVAPGDSFQYSFRIPPNQSPGTHWYHPHKHGSVALQVSNGMSGAFIVEGSQLDSLTAEYGMREHLLAIQQVDAQLNLVDGNFAAVTLINGQPAASLRMRPNEVLRLRIVNENVSNTAHYQLFFPSAGGQPKLYDVSRDGVRFAPANYDTLQAEDSLYIAPGNRLDVFVRAPAGTGTFELRARRVVLPRRTERLLQGAGTGGGGGAGGAGGGQAPPLALLRMQVVPGTGYNTRLPASLNPLPGYLANLPGPLDTASIFRDRDNLPVIVFTDSAYDQKAPPNSPTRFYLGNAQNPYMKYDPSRVYVPTSQGGRALPMVLGQVQTWQIMNYGIAINHPFHIHINPFQVVYVSHPNPRDPYGLYYEQINAAAAAGNPIWMDVVPLPMPDTAAGGVVTRPGYVLIRQRYDDFTGEFVMHCHILGHEERGMMQLLQVTSDGQPVPPRSAAMRH